MDCYCWLINPHLEIKSGGTFKQKKPALMNCSRCHLPIKKFYYIHQCISRNHELCYECIKGMGVCKRCKHYFTCILEPNVS